MKIIAYKELKGIVKSGDVIALAALSTGNLPMEVLKHLAEQHDEDGKTDTLTFIVSNDISDFDDGFDLDSFISRGMVKRIIASLIIASPFTIDAIKNNEIEAYFLPQGVIATHYKNHAYSSPGMISKIGLNTIVDPRYSGGKMNDVTEEDLVSLIEINDEEYLHYNFPAIDVTLLRGTYADEKGNIFMTHESHLGEGFSAATAARKNNGIVIVQVKEIIESGKFNPNDVFIPGELVDYVVINENPKYHKQVIQTYYDPALSGHHRIVEPKEGLVPFSARKIILRRSSQFLKEGDGVSVGYGINNELSNVLREEAADHLVRLNIDTGIFGGMIGSGNHFGMNYNLDARMRHDMTWDFIYNGGLDVAFLSFAEIDGSGNVNVSKFGNRMNGNGGFIDLSQTIKTLIFSGTMVVGAKSACENNELYIEEEGFSKKFVDHVKSLDFNAAYSKELGQRVYYVTERAVFQLAEDGLELIEIAPGLDLERDVLLQMDFKPAISKELKVIDEGIFHETWGKLAQSIKE
ncbi:fatty acid degradation protein FadX [Salinicoccus sp. Marseille-QA3877]